MPRALDIMSNGTPAVAALAVVGGVGTVTGVGTAQAGAAPLSYANNLLITAAGATAFILPSNAGIGDSYTVYITTATSALVYPPSGGRISVAAIDAPSTVAANVSVTYRRYTALTWGRVYV